MYVFRGLFVSQAFIGKKAEGVVPSGRHVFGVFLEIVEREKGFAKFYVRVDVFSRMTPLIRVGPIDLWSYSMTMPLYDMPLSLSNKVYKMLQIAPPFPYFAAFGCHNAFIHWSVGDAEDAASDAGC